MSAPAGERRFGGVARLYGPAAAAAFARAHAAVVGIGGVGSWAAEALARSGVGAITLIDLDHVAESNTNRQIHALGDAYGRAKVEVMAERIRAIHPGCRVTAVDAFVTPANVAELLPAAAAFAGVLDCIDDVAAKAALLAHCRALGVPAVTCGGAGGRTDPLRLRALDLARIDGDPLLAKTRYRLRRRHGFPPAGTRVRPFGIVAVGSSEPLQGSVRDPAAGLACAGYGSAVTVTAPMGFAAAAELLRRWARSAEAPAAA